MAPLIAALIPLVPVVIKQVERLFGPKTGPKKFDTVLSTILPFADQIATIVGDGKVNQDEIKTLIETFVQKMKIEENPTSRQESVLTFTNCTVTVSLK